MSAQQGGEQCSGAPPHRGQAAEGNAGNCAARSHAAGGRRLAVPTTLIGGAARRATRLGRRAIGP
eukprot:10753327-Lingulodinium_polyedra.AAC.1